MSWILYFTSKEFLLYALIACVAFRTLLDLWEIALEKFTGGVYVNYDLYCKMCPIVVDEDNSYSYGSSSPDGKLAWKTMREHYERSHPEQLWRVGRIPRGHSPQPTE